MGRRPRRLKLFKQLDEWRLGQGSGLFLFQLLPNARCQRDVCQKLLAEYFLA